MKKSIAILLVFIITSLLVACGVSQEEVIDEITSSIQENVEEEINSGIEQAEQTVIHRINEAIGRDCVIHYEAPEGCDVPKTQYFKSGKVRLRTKKPRRSNHHFMGWTRVEGDNEPRFFAGKVTDVSLTQDTTFYAVWANEYERRTGTLETTFNSTLWSKHKYDVKEKDNIVTITCSCGLEIVERSITIDEFVWYYSNGKKELASYGKKKQEKIQKEYALYKMQEYAPAILNFAGQLYGAILNETDVADNTQDFFGILQEAAEFDNAYAQSNGYGLVQSEEFFGKISKVSNIAGSVIGMYKAAYYFQEMREGLNENATEGIVAGINSIQTVTSFHPISLYYDQMFETLEEGIKLWDKCVKKKEILDSILQLAEGTYPVLEQVIGKQYAQILDESKNDVYSDLSPSAFEVIDRMMRIEKDAYVWSRTTTVESKLISFYIVKRLEIEVKEITGISLEEYINCFKD